MKTRRKVIPQSFEVTIEKLVYGGFGLGRHEGKVVFVPFTVPADRVEVRVVRQRRNFLHAAVVKVLQPGPGRQAPPCGHFGRCGGCQWQHLEYPRQVETKRQILEEVLHHRFPECRKLEIRMQEAPQPFGYRSRARVQIRGFGSRSKVGFFRFQSHELEDVESCPLFRPVLNEALDSVRQTRRNESYDPGTQQLELACSQEDGTWGMADASREADEGFSAARGNEDSEADPVILRRKIGDFTYSVSPSVFFQANDHLVETMVQRVENLAQGSTGTAAALDLFCGVGLFTLALARRFLSVVAVESSLLASRLCAQNATEARLPNIKTICAQAVEWTQATAAGGQQNFDLVLLDPPRAGAGPEVMKRLSDWAPDTIIYVSCDPHTMVRDLACLNPGDYEIDSIEGLDLFPQTYHFESLVRLRRR